MVAAILSKKFPKFFVGGVLAPLILLLSFLLSFSLPSHAADAITGNMEVIYPWWRWYLGYYSPQDEKHGQVELSSVIGERNDLNELTDLQGGYLSAYIPPNLRNNLRIKYFVFDFDTPRTTFDAGEQVRIAFDWIKSTGFNYNNVSVQMVGRLASTNSEFVTTIASLSTSGNFSVNYTWTAQDNVFLYALRIRFTYDGSSTGSSGVTRLTGTFTNVVWHYLSGAENGDIVGAIQDLQDDINSNYEDFMSYPVPNLDDTGSITDLESLEQQVLGSLDFTLSKQLFSSGSTSMLSLSSVFASCSSFLTQLSNNRIFTLIFSLVAPLGVIGVLVGLVGFFRKRGE